MAFIIRDSDGVEKRGVKLVLEPGFTLDEDTDGHPLLGGGSGGGGGGDGERYVTARAVLFEVGDTVEIPLDFPCTIVEAEILADASGSAVADVLRATDGGFPTFTSIAASAKPTLSSQQRVKDSTLTGWTTSLAAGDTLRIALESLTTATQVTIALKLQLTDPLLRTTTIVETFTVTGTVRDIPIDTDMEIIEAEIQSDANGSATVEVRRATDAGFPTFARIDGGTPMTLASQHRVKDGALSGWTTTLTAGDTLRLTLATMSTASRVTVALRVLTSDVPGGGYSGAVTVGTIPKAASDTLLTDSIMSESAGEITVAGALDVTGAAEFDGAVTVAGVLTANGTLETNSGHLHQTRTTAITTTLDATDHVLFVTATATVNLPAAASHTGRQYLIIATTGITTLDPNSTELIDGASTLAITGPSGRLIYSNGTAWFTAGGSSSGSGTLNGTGSPEGVQTANVGTVYVQTDASPATDGLWYKKTGSGNTGWEQVVASDGSGGSGGSDGGLVFIAEFTASGAASLDITGIGDMYDEYELRFAVTASTDNRQLRLRFSSNGGTSFDSGGSDYKWTFKRMRSGTTGFDVDAVDNADSFIPLANNVGNASGELATGVLVFPTLRNTSAFKLVRADITNVSDVAEVAQHIVSGMRASTSGFDALQLLWDSGNISGWARLYGVAKTPATGTLSGTGCAVLFDATLTASAANIDTGVNGIAAGYDVIEVWALVRTTEAVALSSASITVNNDTGANYDRQFVRGANTTTSASVATAAASWGFFATGASAESGSFQLIRLTIPGYDQTVAHKIAEVTDGNCAATLTTRRASMQIAQWRSSAAITRMQINAGSGSLVAGSRLLIIGYGGVGSASTPGMEGTTLATPTHGTYNATMSDHFADETVAAKWNDLNVTGLVVSEADSCLVLRDAGASGSIRGKIQAVPAGNFTVVARVTGFVWANYHGGGIVLYESSSQKKIFLKYINDTTPKVYCQRHTSTDTYNADIGTAAGYASSPGEAWLAITYNGTDYSYYYSPRGVKGTYFLQGTQAKNAYFTTAATDVGLAIIDGQGVTMAFDCFFVWDEVRTL